MKSFFLRILLLSLLTTLSILSFGQGIGINDLGIAGDSSAMLDIGSTTKGTLLPRMNTTQRDAIVSPAQGLIIFNLSLNCLQINIGTRIIPIWECLQSKTYVKTYCPTSVDPSHSGTVYNPLTNPTMVALGLVTIPYYIDVRMISLYLYTFTDTGAVIFGIYSENGQNKIAEVTSPSIDTAGVFSFPTGSTISLKPGNYYFALLPINGLNADFYFFTTIFNTAPGRPKVYGNLIVPPGSLPASFNPATLLKLNNASCPRVRLDN